MYIYFPKANKVTFLNDHKLMNDNKEADDTSVCQKQIICG